MERKMLFPSRQSSSIISIYLFDILADVQGWCGETSNHFWSVEIPINHNNDPQMSASSSSSSSSSATDDTSPISSTWQHLVDRESERLAKQQEEREQTFTPIKANCKNDTTSWLPRTGWIELFKGKDPKVLYIYYPGLMNR
jgi:hypothetical protein